MHVHFACLAAAISALPSPAIAQLCPSATQWAASADDGIRYGRAVAFNGTFVAIGDYSADGYTGRVNLHGWDGHQWVVAAAIDGVLPQEEFGNQVEMSGDWMAITSPETGNGFVELWHFHTNDWHLNHTYESPEGFTLANISLSWPHLAIVETTNDNDSSMYCLTYDEITDDWTKSGSIWTSASDAGPIQVTISGERMGVSEPWYSSLPFERSGTVKRFDLIDGLWTFNSTVGYSWDDAMGGQCLTSDGALQAWAGQGYYATGRAHTYSTVTVKEFTAGVWSFLSIELNGHSVWNQPGSQVNDIAIDGDDMVVVLWVMDPDTGVSTWSSHHLHREGDSFVYQGELVLPTGAAELDPGAPRYVSAIHDGIVVFDAGVADAERVVFAIPLEDCDGSGRADACEVLADGADTDADGTLDRCTCLGDLNHDGHRDGDDLMLFLARWGGATAHGDLDGDGATDIRDLINLIRHWGDCG